MPLNLQSPRLLLEENKNLVFIVILFIAVGFYLGTKTEYQKSILEPQPPLDYSDISSIAIYIWKNNAWVSFQAFSVLMVFHVAVFSVGLVHGVLFSTMPFDSYLIVLATFGALELFAAFLSIFAGFLYIKAIILKLKREEISLTETAIQSLGLFLLSLVLMVPAAIIEATLIYSANFNPEILTSVLLGGSIVSILLIYLTLRKREFG